MAEINCEDGTGRARTHLSGHCPLRSPRRKIARPLPSLITKMEDYAERKQLKKHNSGRHAVKKAGKWGRRRRRRVEKRPGVTD